MNSKVLEKMQQRLPLRLKWHVSLVSMMYAGRDEVSLHAVGYDLFAKKNKTSEKLPPTMNAFKQHIKPANYQAYIFSNAAVQYLSASPVNNGWALDENGHLVPKLKTLPPAPEAL